jgi:hypothetical protein
MAKRGRAAPPRRSKKQTAPPTFERGEKALRQEVVAVTAQLGDDGTGTLTVPGAKGAPYGMRRLGYRLTIKVISPSGAVILHGSNASASWTQAYVDVEDFDAARVLGTPGSVVVGTAQFTIFVKEM